MEENRTLIPVAILVAIIIIVGAVFASGKQAENRQSPTTIDSPIDIGQEFAIRPVTSEDHILGSPDADIVIVEYSDYECPYCARHHPTMEKIMEEYGKDGKVAWVYRHYPIDKAHTKARGASEASECVANIAGEAAFWNFSSRVFNGAPASLTPSALKKIALDLGTDEAQYDTCVAENTYADDVEADKKDGDLIAGTDPNFGTPYSLIIRKDGVQTSLVGAQPYEVIKRYIDTLLEQYVEIPNTENGNMIDPVQQ